MTASVLSRAERREHTHAHALRGVELLHDPFHNKGTAFDEEERRKGDHRSHDFSCAIRGRILFFQSSSVMAPDCL